MPAFKNKRTGAIHEPAEGSYMEERLRGLPEVWEEVGTPASTGKNDGGSGDEPKPATKAELVELLTGAAVDVPKKANKATLVSLAAEAGLVDVDGFVIEVD